jgi:hypothetical protein
VIRPGILNCRRQRRWHASLGSYEQYYRPFHLSEITVPGNLVRGWRKFLDSPYYEPGVDQCVQRRCNCPVLLLYRPVLPNECPSDFGREAGAAEARRFEIDESDAVEVIPISVSLIQIAPELADEP